MCRRYVRYPGLLALKISRVSGICSLQVACAWVMRCPPAWSTKVGQYSPFIPTGGGTANMNSRKGFSGDEVMDT